MTLEISLAARRGDFTVEAEFSIEAGRTTALIGPNGAGKTTLISALAGLVPIDRGFVRYDGSSIEDVGAGVRLPAARRDIGLLPQESLLFPHMTVLENVAFPLRCRGVARRECRRRAMEWLERMRIPQLAHARADRVSGGEARRAALCRAMVFDPRILLLDEPLAGLDVEARIGLRDLLWRSVESFSGVRIVITHEPLDALLHADQLAIMERGKLIQCGTSDEVRGRPRSPFIASFLGMNVVRGKLEKRGNAWALACPEGELFCMPSAPREGTHAAAIIHPHDIAVLKQRPHREHGNIIEGTVSAVSLKEERAWVSVAATPSLNIDMPLAALKSLELSPGDRVWMIVRLPSVELHPL